MADDTAEIRTLVKAFLRLEGESWDMTFAESGTEAVLAFHGETFDFVLLDFMMPGLNGLEAAREIRASGYRGPLVIWSSAGIMVPSDEALAIDAEILDKSEIRALMTTIKQTAQALGSAAVTTEPRVEENGNRGAHGG